MLHVFKMTLNSFQLLPSCYINITIHKITINTPDCLIKNPNNQSNTPAGDWHIKGGCKQLQCGSCTRDAGHITCPSI